MLLACAALALVAGCASVPKARIENGQLIIDSPYDLELGSTEYAKLLGSSLRSHPHVSERGGKWTTNTYCFGEARLSKPYFGLTKAWLSFEGDDRKLESVHLVGKEKLTFTECCSRVRKMAEDFESKTGDTVDCLQEDCVSEEMALEKARELADEIEGRRGKGERIESCSSSFITLQGTREIDGKCAEYVFIGFVSDKKEYSVSFEMRKPHRFAAPESEDKVIQVYTNNPSAFSDEVTMAEMQKKSHEEAAALRETFVRLLGVDFDKPEQKLKLPIVTPELGNVKNADPLKKEWRTLEKPFAGMNERKLCQSLGLGAISFCSFSLRHVYDGGASEEDRDRLAKEFLLALEKECGTKIPPIKDNHSSENLVGDGVPTFGDKHAIVWKDIKTHFVGQIGDIFVTIKSAPPRYVLRGGKYEVAIRGAVVADFVQTPFSGASIAIGE